MYCRNCGCEVSEGTTICFNCRLRTDNRINFCSYCGSKLGVGQSVCMNCGFSVEGYEVKKGTATSSRTYKRAKEGKWFGGVFSGAHKYLGFNKWLGRIIAIFLPVYPIWIMVYIIICLKTPKDWE